MKFSPDHTHVQTITSYGAGWFALRGDKFTRSLVLGSKGQRIEWNVSRFEDLTPAHFEQLATMDAELVIFGSGTKLRFVPPAWLQALMKQRIGMETMDTQAACRTYNVLASEGRSVIAALLLETPTGTPADTVKSSEAR
jgi:uncharacterized protein